MIKEMQGFKAIRSRDRLSFNGDLNHFSVEYPIEEKVFPKINGSRLFFFKHEEDAITFRNHFINHFLMKPYVSIVPCIAYECSKINHIVDASSSMDIFNFWKGKRSMMHDERSIMYGLIAAPKGTWGAKAIMCLG